LNGGSKLKTNALGKTKGLKNRSLFLIFLILFISTVTWADVENCDNSEITVTLDADKSPWNEFLEQDTTVTVVVPLVVVLANSIDYSNSLGLITLFRKNGFEIFHNTASLFHNCKQSKLIVVLGGPDAPEGVGEIVREILTEDEQNSVRSPGAKLVFVKSNVWAGDQKVIVLAGADRKLTLVAIQENLEGVAAVIYG
jgi:hypothetical protein